MVTTSLVGVSASLLSYVKTAAVGVLVPLAAPIICLKYINYKGFSSAVSFAALGVCFGTITGTVPVLMSCLLTKCGVVSGAIFSKVALIWYTNLAGSSAGFFASYFVGDESKARKIIFITAPVLAMLSLPILSRAFLSCPVSCLEALACTVSTFFTNTGLISGLFYYAVKLNEED